MKKLIRVKDVMQDHFHLIDGLATVREALEAMKKEKATALIVNRRSEDDELGIVLLADISKNVLAKDRAPERVNIYEIMSKPVVSVSPDMDVRYCSRLFDRFGLSLAPVVEDDEVIGVVDYSALVLKGLAEL